jgi:SAM-dependent methyltransferase
VNGGTLDPTYLVLLEQSLPDRSHPDYDRWKHYALTAVERGRIIVDLMRSYLDSDGASVLDLGCGEGGAAIAFAQCGAEVTAVDISPRSAMRSLVRSREESGPIRAVCASGIELPFTDGCFDLVICQDVVEHVPSPLDLAAEIARVLRPGGALYLTAPNRLAPYNCLRDPHFSLFGVSLMPRWLADWYVVRIRRRLSKYDVEQLPTLFSLERTFATRGISLRSYWFERTMLKIDNPAAVTSTSKRRLLQLLHRTPAIPFVKALIRLYDIVIVSWWVLVGHKHSECEEYNIG